MIQATIPDLFHYTKVGRLAQMVKEDGFYFTRLVKFEDEWEGRFYKRSEGGIPAQEWVRKRYGAHCWTTMAEESWLHWKAYGDRTDGVVLCTSRGRLSKRIEETGSRVVIGKVVYGEKESKILGRGDRSGRIPRGVFEKREMFRGEQEIRMITELDENEQDVGGGWRTIGLAKAITHVRTHPKAETWIREAVARLVGEIQGNQPKRVHSEKSSLAETPEEAEKNWRKWAQVAQELTSEGHKVHWPIGQPEPGVDEGNGRIG